MSLSQSKSLVPLNNGAPQHKEALASKQLQFEENLSSYTKQHASVPLIFCQSMMLLPPSILSYPVPPSMILPLAKNDYTRISSYDDGRETNNYSDTSSNDASNSLIVSIVNSKKSG